MFKKTACDSPFVEAPCFLHRQVRLTDLLEYRGQRHLHTTQSLSCEKPLKIWPQVKCCRRGCGQVRITLPDPDPERASADPGPDPNFVQIR
jgi:hypothetical protein